MKLEKIRCPHCGAEYLPSEIYLPEDFLPDIEDIVKDEKGRIVAVHEKSMNLDEEYTCDYCNHRFNVHASVVFLTENNPQHDYNYDFEDNLYPKDREELPES